MRNIENFDELFYGFVRFIWSWCRQTGMCAASAGSGLHWGSQSWPLRSCLQSLLSPLARHQPPQPGE